MEYRIEHDSMGEVKVPALSEGGLLHVIEKTALHMVRGRLRAGLFCVKLCKIIIFCGFLFCTEFCGLH